MKRDSYECGYLDALDGEAPVFHRPTGTQAHRYLLGFTEGKYHRTTGRPLPGVRPPQPHKPARRWWERGERS